MPIVPSEARGGTVGDPRGSRGIVVMVECAWPDFLHSLLAFIIESGMPRRICDAAGCTYCHRGVGAVSLPTMKRTVARKRHAERREREM
jgi:hypothetical protein